MILALLLLLAPSPPTTPSITSERTGENQFSLTVEAVGISSVEQGQELLRPTARNLCGDLAPTFTTFRWAATDRIITTGSPAKPGSLRLEQDLVCGEPPQSAVEAAAVIGPDWQPADGDREKVIAASYAYFSAKDEGRYAPAYDFLSEGLRQMSPFNGWESDARSFREKAGPVTARRVVGVSWYANPAGARPGLYAAADFTADFAKVQVCGYAVWLLRQDGSWRLVREEQNILDHDTARSASPEQLARIRGEMGCKG